MPLNNHVKKKPFFKITLLILFLGFLFWIFHGVNLDFSQITVEKFKEKINAFGIWGPVIYIIFYIFRPLIFFPAAVLSASAGVIWGLQGFLYLQIAANLSAVGEFLIARYFARETVEKFLKGKSKNLDEAISRKGFLTVLLIRLIPNLPWDIQNLGLGLTNVRFKDYFLATLLGIGPGSFALVYFGASFISVITNPKHFWKILLAFAFFIGIYYFQKYLKSKKS